MKAGNITVRNEEMRLLDVALRRSMGAAKDAREDMAKYSSLTEAEALDKIPGLDSMEETLRVVVEITKDTTPLVRKDTVEFLQPDSLNSIPVKNLHYGKFIEIDADGKDVISGATGDPKVAIDPKLLERETKAAVL